MIHSLVITGFILLLICILIWFRCHRQFQHRMYQAYPEQVSKLCGRMRNYTVCGELINYLLTRGYRELNDAGLNAYADRLLRHHQRLIISISLLIFVTSLLIVFSSDPGKNAELWQLP